MEKQVKNVLEFYELANELKHVLRTGWLQWAVSAERIESVAEHIFSAMMLAVAINSEFNYDIDIKRVVFMLAVHELEEIIIGDITPYQGVSEEDKTAQGKEAVKQVLSCLTGAKEIEDIINEFEEASTVEARFAYWVDKLDAGLQCKIYDIQGFIDMANEKVDAQRLAKLKEQQHMFLSDSWLERGVERYGFDDVFNKIALEARDNNYWGRLRRTE